MISIIGSGKVGSAVAFLCGSLGLDDVTLVNRHEKKAAGEALDISNTIPDSSTISVSGTGDYAKITGSAVVVVTASSGVHMKNRTEKMFEQASMIRDITKKIAKYSPEAKILVVTNPVDVLTYVTLKEGNLPSKNVIGVAASLDSSRFRYLLAKSLGTNQSRITDALVLGEHDDSMVPIFSRAKFSGRPVLQVLDDDEKTKITVGVRGYWKSLREFKGYSVFGIAKNTYDIIRCIVKNETLNVPGSVLLDGQYDISGVCIGVPLCINGDGVNEIQEITITEEELQSLQKSASIVQKNIAKVCDL